MMQSPVGNHPTLESVTLTDGLKAFRCTESGGHWIPAENYWTWQRNLPPATDHCNLENQVDPTNEITYANRDRIQIAELEGMCAPLPLEAPAA